MPDTILGAAWGPQKERMDSGIYFPLLLVLVNKDKNRKAIYFLPVDKQIPEMFVARKPLSKNAKRSGWQGFTYDLRRVKDSLVRLDNG